MFLFEIRVELISISGKFNFDYNLITVNAFSLEMAELLFKDIYLLANW